jgi:hypothetical protein
MTYAGTTGVLPHKTIRSDAVFQRLGGVERLRTVPEPLWSRPMEAAGRRARLLGMATGAQRDPAEGLRAGWRLVWLGYLTIAALVVIVLFYKTLDEIGPWWLLTLPTTTHDLLAGIGLPFWPAPITTAILAVPEVIIMVMLANVLSQNRCNWCSGDAAWSWRPSEASPAASTSTRMRRPASTSGTCGSAIPSPPRPPRTAGGNW